MARPPKCKAARLFTAGEWLTLCGMIVVVASAAQPWQRLVINPAAAVPALYVSRSPLLVNGFGVMLGRISVGWAVVVAAVACGALLLFTPSEKEKRTCLLLQTGFSALILGVASFHMGLFAGVVLAVVGSLLLLTGGALRYR